MTQPTKEQVDALVDATGRAVLFPWFKERIAGLEDIEDWALTRGMGSELAPLFAKWAGDPAVVEAVGNVDVVRKAQGHKTPVAMELWEDKAAL